MLTGVHFLLTYACTGECDHCFLYCGPAAAGTFTLATLEAAIAQARAVPTVEEVYFEGGEPFLFYPVMVEGIRAARELGLRAGVVTNAYWATSAADAALWLRPLRELGVGDLSISEDEFHGETGDDTPTRNAYAAAVNLGIPVGTICIDKPAVTTPAEGAEGGRGEPVVGGGALFRGRAADKLTEGLPRKAAASFAECPHEDLKSPKRVHIDPQGNVHVCQGISIGNIWVTPLADLMRGYDPSAHPIVAPLVAGGPARLAREYDLDLGGDGFVDACHLCFLARRALLQRFPAYLAPPQVYGVE